MHHSLPGPAVPQDMSADLWNSAVCALGGHKARGSWDVAVTAIGLAYVSPTRAWSDLRHLFEAQRPDGQIAPDGFVEPPLHAVAAWEVYRRAAAHGTVCAHEAGTELSWLYPRLVAQQDYLIRGRDAGGAGLASVVRGADAVAECPSFNAILAAAELALVHLAAVVGADPTEHRRRARQLTETIATRLYDEQTRTYRSRNVRTGALSPVRNADGLMPLLLPDLPREHVEALVAEVTSPRFGLPATTGLPAPSFDRAAPADSPEHGRSIRIDVNWLLRRGMLVHGYRDEAEDLRTAMIRLAHRAGLYEGFHPDTGAGVGAPAFGPTAALSLDLLADRSVPAYARAT
ncbi:hypothetical protein AB0M36_15315 [Actinoplanes sp. NPDC051346]|uniref:MGH1-like glycoside hydrolase domain-containing protein n=1 Tax=Actinoplanes sp. NPDC051346 TaxID=3155048 RepID=UPI00341BF78C